MRVHCHKSQTKGEEDKKVTAAAHMLTLATSRCMKNQFLAILLAEEVSWGALIGVSGGNA